MKKLTYLLLLISCVSGLSACEKEPDVDYSSSGLVGSWHHTIHLYREIHTRYDNEGDIIEQTTVKNITEDVSKEHVVMTLRKDGTGNTVSTYGESSFTWEPSEGPKLLLHERGWNLAQDIEEISSSRMELSTTEYIMVNGVVHEYYNLYVYSKEQ